MEKQFADFKNKIVSGEFEYVKQHFKTEWLDKPDKGLYRPIHHCCQHGHSDIAYYLLTKGCNVEVETNKRKYRPIHLAAESGHDVILKMLIDSGCELEPLTSKSKTPLDLAETGVCRNIISVALKNPHTKRSLKTIDSYVDKEKNSNKSINISTDTSRRTIETIEKASSVELSNLEADMRLLKLDPKSIGNTSTSSPSNTPETSNNSDDFSLFHFKKFVVVCQKNSKYDEINLQKFRYHEKFSIIKPIIASNFDFTDKVRCDPSKFIHVNKENVGLKEYVIVNQRNKIFSPIENSRNLPIEELKYSVGKSGEQCLMTIRYGADQTVSSSEDTSQTNEISMKYFVLDSSSSVSNLEARILFNTIEKMDVVKDILVAFIKEFWNMNIENQANLMTQMKITSGFIDICDNENKPIEDTVLVSKQLCLNVIHRDSPKSFSKQISIVRSMSEKDRFLFPLFDRSSLSVLEKSITDLSRLVFINSFGNTVSDRDIFSNQDELHCIIIRKYEKISQSSFIGSGNYGSVFKCNIEGSKKPFAVKEISYDSDERSILSKDIVNEIMVSCRIGFHPNLIEYRGFLENNDKFCIVMDCMKESLYRHLKHHKPLKEYDIISFAKQILKGLQHLHHHKIIHRDLRCKNVLLDENNGLKLCDFGISKCLNGETARLLTGGANTQVGTMRYMAPELFPQDLQNNYPKHGKQVDIWSFGATMIELITGNIPFPKLTECEAMLVIRNEKRIEYDYPSLYSVQLHSFLKLCLKAEPKDRPTCTKLLNHPIFKEN